MARTELVPIPNGRVSVVFTDRSDGDFAVDGPPDRLEAQRRSLVDRPWTWLRQVHGDRVVTVGEPGEWAGSEADGALTTRPGCPVAVMTADCAPVVLVADAGVAVVHAGWRGIKAGIIGRAAERLRAVGGTPVTTLLGPCISPAAYEFGEEELDSLVERFGPSVRSHTAWATPALDVPRAIAAACDAAGWPPPPTTVACTSGESWFSHRTRSDRERQAAVAWIDTGVDTLRAGAGE